MHHTMQVLNVIIWVCDFRVPKHFRWCIYASHNASTKRYNFGLWFQSS